MALRWQWDECIGELTIKDQAKARLMVYQGNALMIILNEWQNDKGERRWSMYDFFADKAHFDNCRKDKTWNYIEGWEKLTLWEVPNDLWKVIKILHKDGVEIELISKPF